MKLNTSQRIFRLMKHVLLFSIMFFNSYTFASDVRIEGDDFKENLIGRWEGNWTWIAQSGKQHLKIIKIDGNKVHLTGFQEHVNFPDTDEVNGRIENSTLLLSWPASGDSGCIEEYRMIKDDSNNLILDGQWQSGELKGKVQLKKIE